MLTPLFSWWASVYADHAALRTAVEFLHVGGLAAGGGFAIATDLAALAATTPDADARYWRGLLASSHWIVLPGLAALTLSGLLLTAADPDTFLHSRVFWLKMALFAALLVNGARLTTHERRMARGDAGAWAVLRRTALMSLVLWTLTTLAGAALPNLG